MQTDTIARLDHRMVLLETKLRSPQLPEEQRDVLERELVDAKQMLLKSRTMLNDYQRGLQRRQKPVALVACLVFGCFLLYSTYVLVFGP